MPIRFKLSPEQLEKLRRISQPDDGLHIITKFAHHPGFQGIARDCDGTGFALREPTDDQMASLFFKMMSERAAEQGYGWAV